MPVVSLGKVIYHKTPNLMEKLRHADYIIRPDDAHYDLEEINEFCDEHELWPKVIYYDKKTHLSSMYIGCVHAVPISNDRGRIGLTDPLENGQSFPYYPWTTV